MTGIEIIEKGLWKSTHLFFKDEGPVSKGAKTRKINVLSVRTRAILGVVKWYGGWRKYVFYPNNSLFDDTCLEDIAQFMWEITDEHMGRLPNIKRAQELEQRRRQRRITKLEKRKLTKAKKSGTMVLSVDEKGSCIPEMQVVEGREVSQSEKLAPEVQGEL